MSHVEAHDGVVVAAVDCGMATDPASANNRVIGLNSTNGEVLWSFWPDNPTWNFMAVFDGNGSFIFQDYDSGVYRVNLTDGKQIWRAGRTRGLTWTDGGALLGENGVVYAVSTAGPQEKGHPDLPGGLHAYRLADGGLLWERELERPVYAWPAVGRLSGGPGLSVVTGIGAMAIWPWKMMYRGALQPSASLGALCGLLWWCCGRARGCLSCARKAGLGALVGAALIPPLALARVGLTYRAQTASRWELGPILPTEVVALDAGTGELQWRYQLPTWRRFSSAGDEEGYLTRLLQGTGRRLACLPAAFSSPTIDNNGTVYIGHMSGGFYAIKDVNGDGMIDAASEVSVLETGAGFLPSGPSLAPGMLAVASCDSLHVFRY